MVHCKENYDINYIENWNLCQHYSHTIAVQIIHPGDDEVLQKYIQTLSQLNGAL